MLTTLHLYDDLLILLLNLSWEHFVVLQEPVYERLVWEFMSFLIVDVHCKFDEVRGYIRFRLFNHTHEMHLVQFNELLRLPLSSTTTPAYADYNPRTFGLLSLFGAECLTANHVFPRADSQNGVRASELFILWAALTRKAINTGAFTAGYLEEHAKSTKVAIGGGGIVMALAKALGYGAQVDALSILYCPGRIDLITCISMKLFKEHRGGQLWLNHHGHALFPLPNQAKTTITHPSNLVYNDDEDGESGGKSDGGGDDGSDDDVEEVPQGQRGGRRASEGPSTGTSGTAASSSGTMGPSMFQMVLDHIHQLQV
ncbi:hypothetical protein Cgig2_014377 [Carnegiea gigantea]|uniref:Uncharacterized protein n=1 Tax=Carnegiea gigantea TaxID=171969 RepID=A0A9Q1KEK8_9CARY|nr:hypothetical protein Cgig2_014377 [Carnegiea gigantea]